MGIFAFIVFHLFTEEGRHAASSTELVRIIKNLEDLHMEVQGVLMSPHLETMIIFGVSHWFLHYLNWYVVAMALEYLAAPNYAVPFSLDPVLQEMEVGRYFDPTPP